jgi:hypothetical protein
MRASAIPLAALLALTGCYSSPPLPVENPPSSSALWPEKLRIADGVILGENHGTNEYPAAFLDLVKTGPKPMLVGLELRDTDMRLPCSGEGAWPDRWAAKRQDGRRSAAMFKMICELQQMERKGDVKLVYFDDRDFDNPTFYRNASRLIAANMARGTFQKFAVLSGNFHSRNDEGKLADLLEQEGLEIVTATGSTPRGTAWVCTETGCGAKEFGSPFCRPSRQANARPFWTFNGDEEALRIDGRWDACLNVAKITASPPANTQ